MEMKRPHKEYIKVWLGIATLSCLIFIQPVSNFAQAQTSSSVKANSLSYDYENLLLLATQIQTNKDLYQYLNTELAPLLEISPEQQALFEWGAKSKGLSESQLVAILQNSKGLMNLVNEYLVKVTPENFNQESTIQYRLKMKQEFQQFLADNPELMPKLKILSDPTQALVVLTPGNRPAIDSVETFVNHPLLENAGTASEKLIPESDLKAEVLKFIDGAKTQVWANFYDFDLKDVAEAFSKKATQNVDVAIGVDSGVIETKAEVKEIAEYLEKFRAQGLDFVPVSSVGLNHMKIIVRDPHGPNAAVMFLSGNLTQSCIGKEGDLKALPENLRPAESIPNANHAVIVKGSLPAIFAQHQLKKVLKLKIRGTAAFLKGNAGFPMGGAYKFYEAPSTGNVKNPWMILSFSPNGGMGDVNTDILKQVLLTTTGPIRFLQFAFSSNVITEAVALHIQRDKEKALAEGRLYVADIGGLGDKGFTHRDFSSFLTFNGMVQDKTTGTYSVDPNSRYMQLLSPQEMAKMRTQTFSAPAIYGDKSMKIDGQTYNISSKIHHKVMYIPDWFITVAGTSFNFSVNAESNNEQVVIFRNERVMSKLQGAYEYLARHARGTIYDIAMKRNTFPPKIAKTAPDDKVLSASKVLTCEGLFAH